MKENKINQEKPIEITIDKENAQENAQEKAEKEIILEKEE